MSEHPPKEDLLAIIQEIETDPTATQRTVSKSLGISLGKTNYLLKELIKKDIIKTRGFLGKPGKLKKIGYILTAKGLVEKLRLTYHFLKKKELEYNILKKEWEGSIAAKETALSAVAGESPQNDKQEGGMNAAA